MEPAQYDTMCWLCCLVLLIAASGWRPRFTSIPHAYVAFSVFTGISIPGGGDQITWVLTLLLAIVSLGDNRRWHWQPSHSTGPKPKQSGALALLCISAVIVARIQMAVLYFQSCVAKLPHAEWVEGSALYYWVNNYAFGAPHWLRPAVNAVVHNPLGVAAMTWGPLVLEIVLAAAFLLPQKVCWVLLPAGVLFHLSIAVVMGLWSFSFAMSAGLLLLLAPLGHDLDLRGMFRRVTRRAATPHPAQDEPAKEHALV